MRGARRRQSRAFSPFAMVACAFQRVSSKRLGLMFFTRIPTFFMRWKAQPPHASRTISAAGPRCNLTFRIAWTLNIAISAQTRARRRIIVELPCKRVSQSARIALATPVSAVASGYGSRVLLHVSFHLAPVGEECSGWPHCVSRQLLVSA